MAGARQGVLIDLEAGKAVVLTPKGEFLRLNRVQPGWEVGREVFFEWPETEIRPWWVRPWVGRPAWLTAAMAIVIMLVFIPGLLAQAPAVGPGGPEETIVTYVTIDINPSLELGLDAQDRVVSVTDLNEDAGLLTEGIDLLGQPVDLAVEKLTEAAIEKAFINLDKGNGVFITAVSTEARTLDRVRNRQGKNQSRQDLEARLEAATQKALAKRQVAAPVAVIPLTPEVRSKARELGVSAGKLMLWLRAQEQGVHVPLEEFKGQKLAESIRKAGVEPKRDRREVEFRQVDQVIKKYDAEISKEIQSRRAATQEGIKQREARDRERREHERQERLRELKERQLKERQLRERLEREREKKDRELKESRDRDRVRESPGESRQEQSR